MQADLEIKQIELPHPVVIFTTEGELPELDSLDDTKIVIPPGKGRILYRYPYEATQYETYGSAKGLTLKCFVKECRKAFYYEFWPGDCITFMLDEIFYIPELQQIYLRISLAKKPQKYGGEDHLKSDCTK